MINWQEEIFVPFPSLTTCKFSMRFLSFSHSFTCFFFHLCYCWHQNLWTAALQSVAIDKQENFCTGSQTDFNRAYLVLHMFYFVFCACVLLSCRHSSRVVSVIVTLSCWVLQFSSHSCQTEASIMCFIFKKPSELTFPAPVLLSAPVEHHKNSTWQAPGSPLQLQVFLKAHHWEVRHSTGKWINVTIRLIKNTWPPKLDLSMQPNSINRQIEIYWFSPPCTTVQIQGDTIWCI